MKRHPLPKGSRGSTLLVTLAIIVLLSMIAGTTARVIVANRCILSQNASWQEALVAAEAGVHQGIAQLQDQLLPQLNQTVPPDLSGSQSFNLTLSHGGEGTTTSGARYVLTGTYCRVSASGTTTRPYFRVVSTGSCSLSGNRFFTMASADTALRKLTLSGTAPRATRQVEVWMRPFFSTDTALTTNGVITMNNHNIVVDSFNSTDPARSIGLTNTNPGQPSTIPGFFNSVAINNANGGTMLADHMWASIGTNSQLIMLNGSYIYGDAATNGGVTTNPSHVYGAIDTDFYQPLSSVSAPNGTFVYPTTVAKDNTITTVTSMRSNTNLTLKGGTLANPARYKLDSIAITGGGSLTFDYGRNNATGSVVTNMNYVELYVTGDFSSKGGGNGDGSVIIVNGVQVKIYTGGNLALGGNGVLNNNSTATSLSIFGITPTDGSTRTMDFGGSSIFYGTVYAPDYDVTLGGTPTYVGSIIGKTATLVGNVTIHYDEALSGSGVVTRFATASWFENPMKQP